MKSLSHPSLRPLCQTFRRFLGAYIIFVMSVRLSARKESAPTGQIITKFHIGAFFENMSRKSEFRKHLTRITDTLQEDYLNSSQYRP